MTSPAQPRPRPWSTLVPVLLLWIVFYASWTLWTPQLLDDADSVHAEVAREMLLRQDPVTLYANGIRYLEKAPLLYWSMATCQWIAGAMGAASPRAMAVASRVPLALAVLALALVCEAFARRVFRPQRAGLYAAVGVLSSFGIFLFTRITIPDVLVCLWTAVALYGFWRTEEISASQRQTALEQASNERHLRRACWGFAAACALNVLSKGLIGVVFPVAIVSVTLLLTRGWRGTAKRVGQLHPWSSLLLFLALAAPWHIAAGLANPTQGHPAVFHFINGHWQVPLPADGNVRGWFWFYFMNEHLLRYLNLRVPHDYDTAPLWLFWGLCLVWLMPWSAFLFKAVASAVPLRSRRWRAQCRRHDLPLTRRGPLLLVVWASFTLLFFSLSTRQEYYVLPALPALLLLVAGWLARCSFAAPRTEAAARKHTYSADWRRSPREICRRAYLRCVGVFVVLGGLFALASALFLLRTQPPAPGADLASLLQQNPADYALSLGHFLDLNAAALGLFRAPLALAALSLFGGPLAAYRLRRHKRDFAANAALAAGAFGFLLAAHAGLRLFAPVISSAQLAEAIAPELKPTDLVAIHGEYESGSTLGFYLKRDNIHILEGRSSNLWYGSFFPDAPSRFETPASFAAEWAGPQRVFLWQSLTDEPKRLPALPGPVYVIARGGGKEIVSNRAH